MARDMTMKQFHRALEKHGMKILPYMGYVDLGNGVQVSHLNAGNNYRAKLAYLLKEKAKRSDP